MAFPLACRKDAPSPADRQSLGLNFVLGPLLELNRHLKMAVTSKGGRSHAIDAFDYINGLCLDSVFC